MGKKAKLKEKAKVVALEAPSWKRTKIARDLFQWPRLRNSRKTIENARKKLETPVAPAMPCKMSKLNKNWVTRCKTSEIKPKLACISGSQWFHKIAYGRISTKVSWWPCCRKNGDTSLQHFNVVRQFILRPQAMKILAAKAAVDKEWENWRNFRRGTWRKSEVRKRWSMKQGRRAQKFILPHWWTSVIWKMLNWRQNTTNMKVKLYSEVIL